MQRSIVVWLIALVGSLLIGAAVPTIAQAETCSPDGKICLVTDGPIQTPGSIRLLIPSEETVGPTVGGDVRASSERLVTQGPSGGQSLWEATLDPVGSDMLGSLEVRARGESGSVLTATFQVQFLSPAVNYSVTITRTKKQVVATYQFDARTTLKVVLQLWLDQFQVGEDKTHEILTHRHTTTTVVGPGHEVVRVVLPQTVITRKCRPYHHCWVLASGRSWAGGGITNIVDAGHFQRRRVK